MCRLALALALLGGSASAQVDQEFLLRGRTLEDQRPTLSAKELSSYQGSIDRLLRAGSCLAGDPSATPAELALNWLEMRDLYDLRVCAFALADQTRDPAELVDALRRSGFAAERLIPVEPVIARQYGIPGDAFYVNAAMAVGDVPTRFGRRVDRWFAGSLSVSLMVGVDGAAYDVGALYNQE